MQQPGLYYPFVHVRDDAWLKMAALYWPSLRRIVPFGYRKHDSPTARILSSTQILRDVEPRSLLDYVANDLVAALRKNAPRLVKAYSIERAFIDWDGQPWSEGCVVGPDAPELGWIHISKFPWGTVDYLASLGLARIGRPTDSVRSHSGGPADWIGLHPVLAGAYMTALAVLVGERYHFQPLTDQADLRVAIPNREVDSAMHLLLGRDTSALAPAVSADMDTYVMLALDYVRPRRIESVPVEKIIECRNDLAEELGNFQDYISSFQGELAELAAIPDGRRQLEAFTEHVEHTINVPLQKLERGLQLHKLEPTRSLLLAGTFVPPVAVAKALSAVGSIPAAVTTVGAVTAVGNAWWQVESMRRAARSGSPVGYMLDVRDRLTKKTLISRIRRIFRGTYGRPSTKA